MQLVEQMNQLIEARMQENARRQEVLVEGWKSNIESVNKYMNARFGRTMTDHETRNLATVLENCLIEAGAAKNSRLFEATTEDSIKFLGVQLPVISALLPSLVLNEIASVQALDRRVGAVFYLDVLAGNTHGSVSAGDTLISSLTGHARANQSQRLYASTLIRGESLGGSFVGNGTLTNGYVQYSVGGATAAGYSPVLLNTTALDYPERVVVIKDALGNIVADDSVTPGTLSSTPNGTGYSASGTVTAAGCVNLVIASGAISASSGYTIDYCYQYDIPTLASASSDGLSAGTLSGVPQVNIKISQALMQAIDFPVRSRYSLGAAIDAQKAHNINLESEITKYLGGEVRFTIDHYGVDQIDAAACDTTNSAGQCSDWNAALQTGQEWAFKRIELNDRFEQGNVLIINKTLRAVATFIVCGSNVMRVVRQLPNFKATAMGKTPPTGPYKAGTLDNRVVIHDPFLGTRGTYAGTGDTTTAVTGSNRYIMGYKGDSFIMSGFIYSPYIPLMATPTLVTSDLMAQKGFLSSAGFKLINKGMYCFGGIKNLGSNVTGTVVSNG